jgi:hypothetical protein
LKTTDEYRNTDRYFGIFMDTDTDTDFGIFGNSSLDCVFTYDCIGEFLCVM